MKNSEDRCALTTRWKHNPKKMGACANYHGLFDCWPLYLCNGIVPIKVWQLIDQLLSRHKQITTHYQLHIKWHSSLCGHWWWSNQQLVVKFVEKENKKELQNNSVESILSDHIACPVWNWNFHKSSPYVTSYFYVRDS